nr:uncharacterized protein LOC133575275 isoform X4 [Nerophis lumbriciformis]
MEEGRHRKVLTRVDPRHGERKGSPAWRKITTDLESLALDTVKWRSAASVQCWRNKSVESFVITTLQLTERFKGLMRRPTS